MWQVFHFHSALLLKLSAHLYWFEVCPSYRYSQKGRTPLGLACYGGHVEVVRALWSAGANKDASENVGIKLFVCSSFQIVCTRVYPCSGSAQNGHALLLSIACSAGAKCRAELVMALLSNVGFLQMSHCFSFLLSLDGALFCIAILFVGWVKWCA